jgi:beta-lactamase class A
MAQMTSLRAEIEQVVQQVPATFGIAVKYLESGEEVLINADRTFQLASVFKIPILITALQAIDAGRFRLDDRIELKDAYKTMPSGILVFLCDGLWPTVKDLLTLMIIISDNTATDMVLDLVGGPQAVNASLRKLGFGEAEINITMNMHQLFEDIYGTSKHLFSKPQQVARFKELGVNFEGEVWREGSGANVATPLAMNRLNEMIFRGQVASRGSCDLALDIMHLQTLGAALPSLLPPEIPVAHKTGSFVGIRNDSGIICVSEAVHVGITVLTRREDRPSVEQVLDGSWDQEANIDKAIGHIARLAFDYGRKAK